MRLSDFNFFVPSAEDGWVIAFNSLTGTLLRIPDSEFGTIAGLINGCADEKYIDSDVIPEALTQGGFFVPDNFDERAEVQRRYWENRCKPQGLGITIAPTVNCNLRCTYCYQEHPTHRICEAQYESIADHIRANLEDGSSLAITWFGGEPLLCLDEIETYSRGYRDLALARGCSYTHAMITNGTLLSRDAVSRLRAIGDFKSLQITLDGPSEIHDQRRVTRSGRGSFEQIYENVLHAATHLTLLIRVNVDRRNCASVADLLERMASDGLNRHVGVDFGRVHGYTDVGDADQHSMSIEEFAEFEAQARFLLIRLGFRQPVSMPTPQFGPRCIADRAGGVLFSPRNLVFKCWNEAAMEPALASGTLGGDPRSPLHTSVSPGADRIPDTKSQAENLERWEQYDPFTHKDCKTCRVQPLCIGGCPWESRKMPTDGPGYCTPRRHNLADILRMNDLQRVISSRLQSKRDHSVVSDSNRIPI